LVVQVGRLIGGRRKVLSISEVSGVEGDVICLQDVFLYRQVGVDAQGHAQGQFEACGMRPRLVDRLRAHGNPLPDAMFQRRVLAVP
ncbi:MAG TPA: CpaF family protein, partial [Bryobacteraceae bacterium]|nr:CpaF family protein [Bryobacteraceae bacterium]